jgi:hypothetical protein
MCGASLQLSVDYPDIASPVTSAQNNDTILLDPNASPYTASNNIDILIYKPLTIKSSRNTQSVTIDCAGSKNENHQAFKVVNDGQGTIFEKLTIINGYSDSGGAIECNDTIVTIMKCNFRYNASTIKGGQYG